MRKDDLVFAHIAHNKAFLHIQTVFFHADIHKAGLRLFAGAAFGIGMRADEQIIDEGAEERADAVFVGRIGFRGKLALADAALVGDDDVQKAGSFCGFERFLCKGERFELLDFTGGLSAKSSLQIPENSFFHGHFTVGALGWK